MQPLFPSLLILSTARAKATSTEEVNAGLESSFKEYSTTLLYSSFTPVLPLRITKPPWSIPESFFFSSYMEIKCTVVS